MRRLPLALLAWPLLLGTAPSAAAPSLELVWSGTSGSGAPGGATMAAAAGDVVTLDVVAIIDPSGFAGAEYDLLGSSGLTAAANSLVPGSGGPPECPQPPNLAAGTCFSISFKVFTPYRFGVVDSGSNILGYDVASYDPEFTPSSMTIGRGVFVVGPAAAAEHVSLGYGGSPGGGIVVDGTLSALTATGTAHLVVPEPATGALLGFGLAALAIAGRR